MRVGKIGVAVIGLVPFNVYGECTPTPDCASIGYTETSCETKSVKCPFDTSKLFCLPCDSKYQYTCSGEYVTSPVGDICKNKYANCNCVKGAILGTDTCNCPTINTTNCTIGTIYYANGTCSNDYIACHNPVGITIKDYELIVALSVPKQTWSNTQTQISNILTTTDASTALTDYAGQSNTTAIVNYYGANTDTTTNAGVYCYNYAPKGLENSKNKWYLPAIGELYSYLGSNKSLIMSAWNKTETPFVSQAYFWSSTQYSDTTIWHWYFTNNTITYCIKNDCGLYVACFLKID